MNYSHFGTLQQCLLLSALYKVLIFLHLSGRLATGQINAKEVLLEASGQRVHRLATLLAYNYQ